MHGNPHQIELVEHDPQGPNGALQNRRVRDVENESLLLQIAAGAARLGDALLGEIDVGPAREAVLPVPGALSVPQ